jgi:hypothetical protein
MNVEQTLKLVVLLGLVIFFTLFLFPPVTLKPCPTCPTVTSVDPSSELKFSGRGYATNRYPVLGRVYFNLAIDFTPGALEGLLFFCFLRQGGFVTLYLQEGKLALQVKNDSLTLQTKLIARTSYSVQAYTLNQKLYFSLSALTIKPEVKVRTFTDTFQFTGPFYLGGVPGSLEALQVIPSDLLKPYVGTISSITLNGLLYRAADLLRYKM